jgi:Tfp pilus assembly protein PilF
MLQKMFTHPLSHALIILLLGFLAYSNTFGVPFVFDDQSSILGNPVIQDLGNFVPGSSGFDYGSRRIFGYFTFALNYHFGGFDVAGYHLFNLAIHLCTALLIYVPVRLTFRTPQMAGSPLAPQAGGAALLAALLFVVHPVQTQAVTYIVQRLTSLATFFYLLALVAYIMARLRLGEDPATGRSKGGADAAPANSRPGWRAVLLLAVSVAAAVLAMKTKEIAFTLPLAALLYEACFFRGEWRRRIFFLSPLLLTLPLLPCSILLSGGEAPENEAAALEKQLRAFTEIPRLHYLFTQFRVIVTYLRLFILPVRQNVDYDYPVFTTFFTPPVFLSLALLIVLFALAIYLYRAGSPDAGRPSRPRPELRLVAFGIFWFFLTLSVESGLVPIADVIFEHRLYLPSVGVAMAAAIAVLLAAQKSSAVLRGRIPLLAVAAAILGLTVATWQRNQVWDSSDSLWEDTVRKSPRKARPWYNLGTYQMGLGQLEEARRSLSQSVVNDPDFADAWHNLGLAHLMAGRYQQALNPLQTALRLEPGLDNAVVNLSIALIFTQRPAEAVARLEPLRAKLPERPDVRYNLGLAYLGTGDLSAARQELAVLRGISPERAADLAAEIKLSGAGATTQ